MRTEHADVWLGFSSDQIEGFFDDARRSITATPHSAPVKHPVHDSVEVADIGIFIARGQVPAESQ
jgi:hypothetical protein